MKMRPLVIANKITDRSTSAFQKYLNDVQNRTVLSPHEEAQFAKRSREGDPVAKKILIELTPIIKANVIKTKSFSILTVLSITACCSSAPRTL